MSFTFNDLNLQHVEVSNGSVILPEGNHIVEVTDAKPEKKKNGTQQVVVSMREVNGTRTITDWIVVYNPNHPKNQEIGRSQLKTLCHHGGHPNPDNPFPNDDVSVLKGFVFGIYVGDDEYNGKINQKVKSYKSAQKVDPSFDIQKHKDPLGAAASSPPPSQKNDVDDDIPF